MSHNGELQSSRYCPSDTFAAKRIPKNEPNTRVGGSGYASREYEGFARAFDYDEDDDEPLIPQRPPQKRARATKRQSVPDPSDKIPSLEDFHDDAQDEFAQEWNQCLTLGLGESEVDNSSDAEWEDVSEDVSGAIVDSEDEDELALPNDKDFAAVCDSATNSDFFLPKFLDYTARLDKDYPDVESFLYDNKSAIQNFKKIVISACRFVHNFAQTINFKEYFKLPRDQ